MSDFVIVHRMNGSRFTEVDRCQLYISAEAAYKALNRSTYHTFMWAVVEVDFGKNTMVMMPRSAITEDDFNEDRNYLASQFADYLTHLESERDNGRKQPWWTDNDEVNTADAIVSQGERITETTSMNYNQLLYK